MSKGRSTSTATYERTIATGAQELCTPDIVDLPIINLQYVGRPFKIKVSTIRMVQHSPFTGKEDLNLHLQAFIPLCHTFDEDGVTQDQMRARLFPFSLHGKALRWFHTLPAKSKQDWEALMRNFMKEFYSPTKTQSLRNKISIAHGDDCGSFGAFQ
jgi:hypothetical protein